MPMIISKNKVICKKKKILTSIPAKAAGLMFRKKITDTGYVFVFEKKQKIDIHMFFVFFPIDVLFLDKDKKVIELTENLKPFRLYFSKKESNYLIELPSGKIKNYKIKVGDKIGF